MKVLVTGSRDWDNEALVEKAFAEVGPVTKLVHGDARGLDKLSEAVARRMFNLTDKDIKAYPAEWHIHGLGAGSVRNQHMLNVEHLPEDPIQVCLAFPHPASRGTWDMVRRVQQLNQAALANLTSKPAIRLIIIGR